MLKADLEKYQVSLGALPPGAKGIERTVDEPMFSWAIMATKALD
jgi:hypothetical protein